MEVVDSLGPLGGTAFLVSCGIDTNLQKEG